MKYYDIIDIIEKLIGMAHIISSVGLYPLLENNIFKKELWKEIELVGENK